MIRHLLTLMQTRTIELPSDSNFALSMKSQQAAEREEQQRIKNLVLNYDLRDENDQHDGSLHNLLRSPCAINSLHESHADGMS